VDVEKLCPSTTDFEENGVTRRFSEPVPAPSVESTVTIKKESCVLKRTALRYPHGKPSLWENEILMPIPLDRDGQPISLALNMTGRINRAINEINGFLRGVLADNYISADECEQLAKWVMGNAEVREIWPVSVLTERLNRIYQDGIADEEERADLARLAHEIIGSQDDETFEFLPADLPLTKPAPAVVFPEQEFVFTGTFFCGTRKLCKGAVESRGGHCADTVRLTTNYLVIGYLMSRDWKFTTHGTKIQKAAEYTKKCPVAIVSEKHWQSFLRA
jgi:hypothetical protein